MKDAFNHASCQHFYGFAPSCMQKPCSQIAVVIKSFLHSICAIAEKFLNSQALDNCLKTLNQKPNLGQKINT
jgi:hypothetical protein